MRQLQSRPRGRGLLQPVVVSLMFLLATVAPAAAQQVTGTLGQADATTTINGKQIPPPPAKFGGVIRETYNDSTPSWPPRVVPPKGAPNILLIMTDDQGYGVPGTFGGVIPTPNLNRIANVGLRYTQFHSTALCSPTRAALITDRNHHSVGYGVTGELSTGYPGYDSIIGPDNATIGEILKENGYASSWFGKDHNTPGFQYSTTAGPFELPPDDAGAAYFDVTGHATADTMPVGSINRARWQGEVASRKARNRGDRELAAVASRGV